MQRSIELPVHYATLLVSSLFSSSMVLSIHYLGKKREIATVAFVSYNSGPSNMLRASVRINPFCEGEVVSSISKKIAEKSRTREVNETNMFQRYMNRLKNIQTYKYGSVNQNEDDEDEIATFEAQVPQWNQNLQRFTLDFNGRCFESSQNNFILIPAPEEACNFGDAIGVRYGKVHGSKFNLDFRFPFSPVSALAIALSSEIGATPIHHDITQQNKETN